MISPPCKEDAAAAASRQGRRPAAACAALWLILAAAIPAAAARAPYAQGEEVVFTGVVTDPEGLPIPELQVTLEASRAAFNVRKLGRVRENVSRLATLTDERGEFSLPFRWDDYYNRFDLVVALPVRTSEGDQLVELQRADLSKRTLQGSPVVSALQVTDMDRVSSTREFLADLDSDDKRKVYEQMGQPERLERLLYPNDSTEVTWWYFRHGRAYRFRDGALRQVIPFDPVEPFGP